MNGQLSEQPLAELIREIKAARLSGALRLARARVQAVVYAQAGAIVAAHSNLRAHRFSESLRRWGLLTDAQLNTVAAAPTETEVCNTLVSQGILQPDELTALRLRQATDVLRPLLLWTDGAWTFDSRARLAATTTGALELPALLLEGTRRLAAEFAAARLRDEDMLALAADDATTFGLALLPVEAFILSRVEAPLKLAELVAISGLPETQTRHRVYALTLAGLLERASWPQIFDAQTIAQARILKTAAPPAGQVETKTKTKTDVAEQTTTPPKPEPKHDPQTDMAALLARVQGADYYHMLGVGHTADVREIKRAYYALAKRFHPDRFRRDLNAQQHARVEAAFAQIAHAYETLTNEKARAVYDSRLQAGQSAPTQSNAQANAPTQPPTAGASLFAQAQGSRTKSSPQQADAEEHFQRGLLALKQQSARMAVAYFAEAVRLAPRQPHYHAFYGRALADDPAKYRQAEAELHAAIALDPNAATHHVMLAEFYQRIAQPRRAETAARRALHLDPRHPTARQLLDQLKKQ
jgi:tetratricopeptide (TPR) repeat protein